MADSDGGITLVLSDIKTRVSKLNFNGLNRTKHDILHELVQPLLSTRNVSEVYEASARVRGRFAELGLFKNCTVHIDESENVSADSSITNLNIVFNVEETNRLSGGVFTSVGQNDASLTLQLNTPNVLGRGEQFTVRSERSYNGYLSFTGTASKPLVKHFEKLNWRPRIDFSMFQNQRAVPWSKYYEQDRGANVEFVTQTETGQSHSVRFETLWRHAHSTSDATPLEVRRDLGHSMRHAIRHEYLCDWRNHPRFPTSGLLFRFTNEIAHFQKDNPDGFLFGRHEVEMQQNVPLYKQISLQGSMKFGFLRPFSGDQTSIPLSEHYFLGGPLNLRGFELNGAGPESDGAALGGRAFWLTGLHLYCPLPLRNQLDEMLRFHGFINAGNIFNPEIKSDALLDDMRLSAGAGLVATFGHNYRLEVNYCFPIRAKQTDKSQNFQFGVGVFYS